MEKNTKVQKPKKQLIYSIEGREKQLVSFLKEKYKKKIQAIQKRDRLQVIELACGHKNANNIKIKII